MHAAGIPLNAAAYPARMESPMADPELHRLTTGLARGDDAAWEQFHREYGPTLFRQLLAQTRGDHALASEALQGCYLRVARHARPCESASMFVSWLRTVARSALSDCRRRERRFLGLIRKHAAGGETPNPAADEAERMLEGALDGALSQLSDSDRALLERKYFASVDVRTLAAELGLTAKAVESRLTRARAELRRALLAALKQHETET